MDMLNQCLNMLYNEAHYYKLASDRGHVDSMHLYAPMLHKGDGIKMDKKEVVRYYKLAAGKGHVQSIFMYANLPPNGEGVEKYKEEVTRYFKLVTDYVNCLKM